MTNTGSYLTCHVISRGNNRVPVFHESADFSIYLSILARCKKELPFSLYHLSLMTNHVHLMIATENEASLGNIMKYINLGYSLVHKEKYERVGHLWQNRYRRFPITNESYMLTCGIYIELNPVRAGMVDRPEEYKWSSYRKYAFGEPNVLIDYSPAYLALGETDEERQRAYKALVDMWRMNPVSSKAARTFFKNQANGLYPTLKP